MTSFSEDEWRTHTKSERIKVPRELAYRCIKLHEDSELKGGRSKKESSGLI